MAARLKSFGSYGALIFECIFFPPSRPAAPALRSPRATRVSKSMPRTLLFSVRFSIPFFRFLIRIYETIVGLPFFSQANEVGFAVLLSDLFARVSDIFIVTVDTGPCNLVISYAFILFLIS